MTEEWSSTNQQKTEPMPPTPAHSEPDEEVPAASGSSSGTEPLEPSAPSTEPAEPSAQGVPVPSDIPAEGTSEGAEPVDGVKVTAIAQEGLADGETDVRVPPTTSF